MKAVYIQPTLIMQTVSAERILVNSTHSSSSDDGNKQISNLTIDTEGNIKIDNSIILW